MMVSTLPQAISGFHLAFISSRSGLPVAIQIITPERIEMDFSLTPKTEQLRKRVSDFMDQYVFPIEKDVQRVMGESGNTEPDSLKDVRKKAKAEGLWNLFLPDEKFGAGLKNYEYAPLCELMGRSPIGARAFNCMAPDTGNMEILTEFARPIRKSSGCRSASMARFAPASRSP